MATFWVSFATDVVFLGVAIVDEDDDADAVTIVAKTIDLGCNPGDGSVLIQKLSREIPESYKNRLLMADEAELLAGPLH
jgi:hypothetical protein